MRVLRDIANSIDGEIQFTVDTPSANMDNKMPVLDLKLWVLQTNEGPQLVHTFYKKGVSSPFTILQRSAMSASTKRLTTFQEGLRRLKNMSPLLEWKDVIPHMNLYSNMLRISGYG